MEGRRERKVVTVLFADLVGFTARAEQLDPEDVEAILRPYHERLRGELERFGGTVEKFIGDAVMALFGAPVAHEDDPERAVRVARKIRAGQVDVNGGRFNPMAPFGGYKRSGLGRENGMDMIKEYLQTKSVWIDMGNEVPNPFVLR